ALLLLFSFNRTPPTEAYTLSLHDALPIFPVKAFNYEEDVKRQHGAYLWGASSFAFATRLADSFAKWRMCANIIGPTSGGAVEDLPRHQFESMGEIETKVPTEILISERREYELSEEGFIALS